MECTQPPYWTRWGISNLYAQGWSLLWCMEGLPVSSGIKPFSHPGCWSITSIIPKDTFRLATNTTGATSHYRGWQLKCHLRQVPFLSTRRMGALGCNPTLNTEHLICERGGRNQVLNLNFELEFVYHFWCWGQNIQEMIKSIPWLLMPCRCQYPRHQQTWYWQNIDGLVPLLSSLPLPPSPSVIFIHLDGSVQERLNSIANALEFRLPCSNPTICDVPDEVVAVPKVKTDQCYDIWKVSQFPMT